MNKFKIIISPSKTFNLDGEFKTNGIRPKYINKAKEIFSKIRNFDLEETKRIYKLSEKKAHEVFSMHQEHGKKLYPAIEMYGGLVFKQLDLNNIDKEWVNEHIIIIDALYGVIKPYDLIAPYRLDFKTDIGVNLKEFWQEDINNEFKNYEIYNLASKEFSSLIKKEMTDLKLGEGQIKKARGILLNKIIKNKSIK